MNNIVWSAATAAMLLLCTPSAPLAQELPAITVTAPNGARTDVAALPGAGPWVLVYVFPGSAPSDSLVRALGERWDSGQAAKTVFVVFGQPDAAKAYLLKQGGSTLAADARWYADEQGAAWKALRFQGSLAVAGMAGASLDWRIDGVVTDPSAVLPAIGRWLGGGD